MKIFEWRLSTASGAWGGDFGSLHLKEDLNFWDPLRQDPTKKILHFLNVKNRIHV